MSNTLLHPDMALERILDSCEVLPPEEINPLSAVGRVLAVSVTSTTDLPPFHNSAMDGFALGSKREVLSAGGTFVIEGQQAAGDGNRAAGDGAWEIMTGARLPDGLDRVIPVEQTEQLENPKRVHLLADVARGQNIREAGSDVANGETVIEAGARLEPQHLMLLTALGIPSVQVAARPKAAVLCTGRELVDDPAQPLAAGQIRNSNGPFLAARLPLAGADLVHTETVGDDMESFLAAFEHARAVGARVIISTGAVSMGRYDFVPQALDKLGAELLFHKIAIRPGKPLLCARLPDDTLFFGLPGNPIAAAVGLRFFVEPALRAMMRLPTEQSWQMPLANDWSVKRHLKFHLKSHMTINNEGQLVVTILPGQESYRIRPLVDANTWVVAPFGATELPAGTQVDVFGLGHLESPTLNGSTL